MKTGQSGMTTNNSAEELRTRTRWIKAKAEELGFAASGMSKAEFMDEEAARLRQWLNKDYHGQMSYMDNHFDKRTDPRKLLEDARSVISLMYNYYTEPVQDPGQPRISRYAYGRDYHKVIKKKLKLFFREMEEEFGPFKGRYFVDSAPVLERDWAKRSGLGWIGKNTMLISPKKGSYFFLAEMIVDFPLIYDEPISDYCGRCRKCIDACPTAAIDAEGYLMDGSKCISYLTIELKSEKIPEEFSGKMENYIFGCDICQEVCPWNRFSTPHREAEFEPSETLKKMDAGDWENLSEEEFQALFEGSAVKRAGYRGMKRNIRFNT